MPRQHRQTGMSCLPLPAQTHSHRGSFKQTARKGQRGVTRRAKCEISFSEQTLSISCFKTLFHIEALTELKKLKVAVVYSNKAIKPSSAIPSVCFSPQETLLFLPYIRRKSKSEFTVSPWHTAPVCPQLCAAGAAAARAGAGWGRAAASRPIATVCSRCLVTQPPLPLTSDSNTQGNGHIIKWQVWQGDRHFDVDIAHSANWSQVSNAVFL